MKSKCLGNEVPTIKCAIFQLWFLTQSYFFKSKFCVYSFDNLYCITLVCLCVCVGRSVMSNLCDPMDWSPPGSSVHASSLVKKTGMGCHALLQGIFPTQGSNLVSCTAGRFFTI